MKTRRQPEIISGTVSSAGVIVAGSGFTVVKTGTGAYTVTVLGLRIIAFVVSPAGTATITGSTATISHAASTVAVSTFIAAGTATDGAFTFIATGN